MDTAIGHGIAEEIYHYIAELVVCIFNKSHVACYALIAYQTAWMKSHYPGEYIAARGSYSLR